VANDGAEGLEAFRKKPTDIVVTDIQMPNMDGLTMAREIRNLDRNVPILVTTAFEQTDYLMRSLEIGIDQYVLKPIQGQRFESALMALAHRLSTEEQLRQKQKLEAEAIRLRHHAALSILLGGIAHDYNNLLQAIVTAVSLAQVKLDPASEAYQILEKSEQSSDQVRQLGRRLLMLANPSNHHHQASPLNALLRRSVLTTLAGSSIRPEFDFRAGEVLIRHNEANLQKAFEALTQNAREALPSGGKFQISTELCEVTAENDKGLAPGLPPHPAPGLGHGHPGGEPAHDLRTLLLHQGARQQAGYGAGPSPLRVHPPGAPGHHQRGVPSERRCDLPHPPARG